MICAFKIIFSEILFLYESDVYRGMTDIIKKTSGDKAMNAFPAIAFLVVVATAVLIWFWPF